MKFFKLFAAALLAFVAGSFLTAVIWFAVIMGIVLSFGTDTTVPQESVLEINLAEDITDAPQNDPLELFDVESMSIKGSVSLYNTLCAIEAAAFDDNIKGIYLHTNGAGTLSAAAVEELRQAIDEFRQESGKFVVAYNDSYSQTGYWLASVADEVYLQPQGAMSWQGLALNVTFYKGLMDKLDLRAEIFRPTACRYKSAVEPYFRTDMSDENRAQMQELASSMWGTITQDISAARGISVSELNTLADNLSVMLPEDALEHRFVDALMYEDQVEELLAAKGVKRGYDGKLNKITLGDYCKVTAPVKFSSNKVAIIYADGDIIDGSGITNSICGDDLAEKLRQARMDDHIKAVVLRVNSPGGSALASDVIWREAKLLREQKPLVVSMGAYAASGGYYISVPADRIVADRVTITGSIGVFGMALDARKFFNNKLGITFDKVTTNTSSDAGSMVRPITEAEKRAVMRGVDKVYDTFTKIVAEDRNLPLEKVLDIAGGRVWTGSDAVATGLADMNGGLKTAIGVATTIAGLGDDFAIVELTDLPEGFAAFVAALNAKAGIDMKQTLRDDMSAELLRQYTSLQRLSDRRGIQTYYPYAIEIQ